MLSVDLKQGSEEWHAFRRTHIGASECAAVMGFDPYKTPYDIWRGKVFGESSVDTPAMARGRALEPVAREEISQKKGVSFHPVTCVSASYPWMMASLDGLSSDGTILEIKCPLPKNFEKILTNDGIVIPATWQWQVQHQLCVTGFKDAILFVYNGSSGLEVLLERDEGMISQLIEKERAFWHDYVLKFNPPPSDKQETDPREDASWLEAACKWKEASENLKEAEAEEKMCRDALINLAANRSCEGGGIKVTKSIRPGTINYKAIPELVSVDLERFRNAPIISWRIS